MSIIIFYEKPGCSSNRKQKKMLRSAGVTVIERNLMDHGMSHEELYKFFENRPAKEWLNPNSPQVKSGNIDIHNLSEKEAFNLLYMEPILIRRPLMIINKQRVCGFDQDYIEELLSISFKDNISNACSADGDSCTADKRSVS